MATKRKLKQRAQAQRIIEPGDASAREPENPELVVGLVAAVGTPLELVQQSLSERLSGLGYTLEILRLSDYTDGFELDSKKSGPGEANRIDGLMNRGNEARTKTGRNDILALAAIASVRGKRGKEPGPLPARAFILRQLKRPEEVHLLRRTYGDGFVLLGVYCPRSEREKNLKKLGVIDSRVQELIQRDEHETELGGQALRDTFHLADLFVEIRDDLARVDSDLKRVIHLLFGLGISTPTHPEYGMFQAYAASLRSAQLGRQVGAALLSVSGDVIAVGTNDVPRFGGGLYWEGDAPDARDHRRGRDSSDEAEEEIVREILERTNPEWRNATSSDKLRLKSEFSEKLRSTRVMSLTEFGRAVHAEAEALLSAARMGLSTKGADLYCTTFPCHVCAKHIVAAGINTVTYIEPYPKSRAFELHEDSISLEDHNPKKVVFRPFVGVAPRRFVRLFSMTGSDGIGIPRKDEQGKPILDRVSLRLRLSYFSALQREDLAAKDLAELTKRKGD